MIQKKDGNMFFSFISGIFLVIMTIGISFAFYYYSIIGTKDNVVSAGIIDFIYTEATNGLTILNSEPISDEIGKVMQTNTSQGIIQGYFDFSITAISSKEKILIMKYI